ncbi:MAG: outer membrane protein assembly factor BamC [Burkholderiales bacterium]|nr:outer membrane protein assembly factor BamC [Burkholderiales bacterium]
MGQFPRLIVLSGVIFSLTGCSYFGSAFTNEKIQYETTSTRAPLQIPPDLSQLPMDDRFVVPGRPMVVTATQVAESEEQRKLASGVMTEAGMMTNVVPQTVMAKIVKDGSERYIQVNLPPDTVWNTVLDFWPSVGLQVEREDPKAGVMETNWAENKANLPQDIIRATLGKLLDFAYSTGERDRYRCRLERDATGGTDIFVTHRKMIEVYTNKDGQTAWQPAPGDKDLEAEMLTRLTLRIENEFNPKQKTRDQIDIAALKEPEKPDYVSQEIKSRDGKTVVALLIDEPFDRAWRRVGLALDRVGFAIEDRDRAAGIYYIRYLDPDYEVKKRNDEGLFTKWFGKEKAIDAPLYRVILQTDNQEKTRVVSEPDSTQTDPLSTSSRILSLLQEQVQVR